MLKYVYAANDKEDSKSEGEQSFLLCSTISASNGFYFKEVKWKVESQF